MNKLLKVFITIFGATNAVFSMFIPIALSLLSISYFGFEGFTSSILIATGIISSLYRAINIGFMK